MSRTPTPDQKRAIATIHSSLPVTAGAGSGKTFVLTHRYFQILAEQAAELDEILAITFTEKAANQMKEKIRHLLTDFAAGRQSEGFPPVMKDGLTLPDREYWHRLLDTFERSYISTIHGFCARILRESAVETGLDPEFTVMDEHTTALQLPGIIRREIFELIRDEDENIALWLQYYSLGEILHRYQGMIRGRIEYEGLREHYLGEKSGDDLLNELREQLEEAIPEEIDSLRDHPVWQQIADSLEKMSPQRETDHFFPHYQHLRDIQARLGRTPDRLELVNLWKAAAENLKSKGAKGNWLGVDLTELKNVMKDFRTEVLEPLLEEVYEFNESDEREAIRLARSGARIFSKVLSGYREWKSERNYLDYNDLLRMAVDLLGQHPHLREKYANQFKFILLDEFQDTNPIQYRLVELLSDNGSGEGSLFVVGDPKQSIYRFRGTEVELFEDARNNLPDPGITLNISFRSRPSILAWYNACFSRVMGTADDQRERARYEQHYIPLEPHREEPDQPAYGVSISFVETEHSSRAFSIDEKIQVEAAHIADWIRNHLGDIKVDRGDGSERARPGDVAILFRKTTHLKRYEHALRLAGIPFFTVSGAGLFEKQEIRDIITVLEALEHPGEGIPVVGALRSHLFGMSDEGLFQLAEAGFRHQWEDVLYQDQEYFAMPESLSDNDRLALAEAREKMQRWCGMKDRVSPGDLLDNICIESGYFGVAGLGRDGPQQLRNVEAFLRIAREFSRSRLATLGGFVEYITSLRDAAEASGPPPTIAEANAGFPPGEADRLGTSPPRPRYRRA